MQSLKDKILYRIRGSGRGSVYSTKDFLDLGNRAAVDQVLSRLTKAGKIRRLGRGLYDYPRTNPRLQIALSPDLNLIARAQARKVNASVQPTGAAAANMLGLTTQVPAQLIFMTDGPSRTLRIGNQRIIFKNVSSSKMNVTGGKCGLIIQALRYLGKDAVDDALIRKIRSLLNNKELKSLSKDGRYAASWISNVVNKITQKDTLHG